MGIELRPMRAEEFDGYLAYSIPDYAAEIASNYGLTNDQARAKVLQEVCDDLPKGTDTSGQELLCISSGDVVIGHIWYTPDTSAHSAFIYDFSILEPYRGKGYGKQALHLFEALLAKDGFTRVGLRVAADNERAQHVYSKGGFQATGINMIKRIGKK